MADGDLMKVDRSKCFMSGECVLMAPQVFEFDDEGYPTLIPGGVESADTSLLLRVEETCPSGALALAMGEE